LCGLDSSAGSALKKGMDFAARFSAEHELAALEQRLREIGGELAEQAEALAACGQSDPLAEGELVAAHASLRDSFWSLKQRCAALREGLPHRLARADEF
jgi:hypothetical protein